MDVFITPHVEQSHRPDPLQCQHAAVPGIRAGIAAESDGRFRKTSNMAGFASRTRAKDSAYVIEAVEILTELRGRVVSVTLDGDILCCLKPRRALDDASSPSPRFGSRLPSPPPKVAKLSELAIFGKEV
jgi:hypothetical protein